MKPFLANLDEWRLRTTYVLLTLRVVRVEVHTLVRALARVRGITLTPLWNCTAASAVGGSGAGRRNTCVALAIAIVAIFSNPTCGGASRCCWRTATRGAELALDEIERSLAIFLTVSLVDIGIVAIATCQSE